MSISASIDFRFYSKNITITPLILIDILISNGWVILDYDSKWYLPIGDVDNFDWQSSKTITDDEIMEICKIKFKNQEIIGLSLTWLDTDTGGSCLFYPNGEFSFLLDINRLESESSFITDFDWYLSKIVPILRKNDIYIESVKCDHII